MFRSVLIIFIAVLTIMPRAYAEDAPILRLYTLDCGDIKVLDANIMDQTDSYEGSLQLKASCYIIQHGEAYMLWDAGFNPEAIKGVKDTDMFQPVISQTIPEALMEMGLKVSDISKIGISHVHFDHIGQANIFKDAELLIGTDDFDMLFGPEGPAEGTSPQFINEWADGQDVTKVTKSLDVFGDGSVVMMSASGHTPGHTILQVNLQQSGPVILVGDLWHFRDNFANDRVPDFNHDAEETKASFQKIRTLAEEKSARLVIQHDPDDFSEMPKFPAYLD